MNNFGGSKTDTVVKLSLFFFISLFSFSVGTFVGKQVSDNERRRIAYEAEYEESRKLAASDEEKFGADTNEAKVSETDVDALADAFVKAEVDAHESKSAAADKPEEKEEVAAKNAVKAEDGFKKIERKVASTPDQVHEEAPKKMDVDSEIAKHEEMPHMAKQIPVVEKAADRIAEGKAPMKTPVVGKMVAAVLPKISPDSRGKFTVQVSSYSTEEEAKKHADELKVQGYSAFYVSAKVQDKVWYRVSVGLFDSRKTADNFKRELMKQANIKTAIIQKIVK